MKPVTLVIGGCRSGKSGHALKIAEAISAEERIFIATCVPYDQEMKRRVERHQKDRDPSWKTFETPVDIAGVINAESAEHRVILVDCLTLWVSNLMMETPDTTQILSYVDELKSALASTQCPVILVSNEVGAGIVPENKIARLYRDLAGEINRKIAETAHTVIWMVAGIPVPVK